MAIRASPGGQPGGAVTLRPLLASREEAEQEPDHEDPDAHPDKPPVRAPHPDKAEERPRPQEADSPGQVSAATLSAPAGRTEHGPVPATCDPGSP